MMELDLQFFAKDGPGGEKTEEPTAKKLKDARDEGQVAKSKEIANALTLIGLFLILKVTIGFIGERFLGTFSEGYNRIPEFIKLHNGEFRMNDMVAYLRTILADILLVTAPFLAVGFVLSFLGDLIQVKWHVTTKPLKPKFSKMDPVAGFKRLFSSQALMELLKSILKIGLIGYMVYTTLRDQLEVLYLIFNMTLWHGIAVAGDIAISLGLKISFVYVVIALLDFAYQKHKFHEEQKMTKQEVKDEYKQAEGDPKIKGKIRQKMMQASQRRMMQDLPKADVVITNPTHFAVAIKYDADLYDAPYVVAKGSDHLAAKIKEVAKENKVEIVENKPLARMLYYNVELGSVIPPELYKAVADILAMVYKMQGKI